MTGANQGIGLEIVRQLCKKFDGKVVLSGESLLAMSPSQLDTALRATSS